MTHQNKHNNFKKTFFKIKKGTLSPMDFYPKILRFDPKIVRSFDMTLSRPCICPLIITKGNDQIPLTSKYESRRDLSVVKNYGELLFEMAQVIPDGIVCFFTSYAYMEEIVSEWSKMGMLQEIMKAKLIFIETKDIVETSLALNSFKKACDCGRGAIFLSVARGKVAEGVDFDRHYGRCVILFGIFIVFFIRLLICFANTYPHPPFSFFGIPFQYSLSRVLRARLDYLKEKFDISEDNFLAFDALRQAAQCVGRVIRSKLDYGLMIFADYRYTRADKRKKLPQWISNHLRSEYASVSTDVAVEIAAQFVKKMGQPHSKKDEIGKSLLSETDLHQKLKLLYAQKQLLHPADTNHNDNEMLKQTTDINKIDIDFDTNPQKMEID
ncbi:hypothetical protein RFI_21142 [Reticulomyxa filosa]|uniref:ATP-dependent helicase C-terminal domain-containing protein n=1 Tax=Reticulomyxa filosa TaxID=46433 RepID=X6MRC3_RETFI|nr:hypothetical protein RFI_21142 [Reticulomyxa filosa]|eukprot:ETO16216.1 hypothetical protein RFI_21142 [Reticulomyxa filosa]